MDYQELLVFCSLPKNKNKPICRNMINFDFLGDLPTEPIDGPVTLDPGLDYDPSVLYPDSAGSEGGGGGGNGDGEVEVVKLFCTV